MEPIISLDEMLAEPMQESEYRAPYVPPEQTYIWSLNRYGSLRMDRMCQACGLSYYELARELESVLIQDPEQFEASGCDPYAGWVLLHEYLSGFLHGKLETAIRLEKKYRRFSRNVELLEKALPNMLEGDEIYCALGATWVPTEFYARFIGWELGVPEPSVSLERARSRFVISNRRRKDLYRCTHILGTPHANAFDLMQDTMNGVSASHKDPETKRIDQAETQAMLQIQETMRQDFRSYCAQPAQQPEIKEAYYLAFGCCRPKQAELYDPKLIRLPGLNPAVQPYDSQRRAVLRACLQKNLLLAHSTGTGKTDCLIESAHELRRMGLSEKPLFVLPNQIFGEFVKRHRFLYPGDDLLVLPPSEFTPKKRQATLARIAREDHDAIYLHSTSFDSISVSNAYRVRILSRQIATLMAESSSAPAELRRGYEHEIKMKQKLRGKLAVEPDFGIHFEDLGITTLLVDEAHHYKNISVSSRTPGVVGLNGGASLKADSMLEKVRCVQQFGRGVIFATGTLISNSLADLFVMEKYLMNETLEGLSVATFDNWIATFGQPQTELEPDVDSCGYRMITRLSTFRNCRENVNLLSQVADFCIRPPEQFPYRRRVISVDQSQEQHDYIQLLSRRTEDVRNRKVSPKDDNLLKITSDGRLCALDMRLLIPESTFRPEASKLTACVREVMGYYREDPENVQIIFCDLGTPKEGFNIYETVKGLLLERGIPEREIAFIHDAKTAAQREKLFDRANRAEVRVLLGSTPTLGEGVNVQRHLRAIHNLDIPWKPSDMEQRKGRMLREGNETEDYDLLYYITRSSFDAYMLQILENKQRSVDELLDASSDRRTILDFGRGALTYGEIKALCVGNPLLQKRIELDLKRKQALGQSARSRTRCQSLRLLLDAYPGKRQQLEGSIRRLREDMDRFSRNPAPEGGMQAESRALQEALEQNAGSRSEVFWGEFCGFHVVIPAFSDLQNPFVWLRGSAAHYVPLSGEGRHTGHYTRLENHLRRLPQSLEEVTARLDELERDREEAIKTLRQEESIDYTAILADLDKQILRLDRELHISEEEAS